MQPGLFESDAMKTFISICIVLLLTGCATDSNYQIYSANQTAVATAKYKAIEAIAASNPNAAAFALMGQGGNSDQMRAPESAGETVLKFLGVLANPLANMYGAHQATKLGIAQSDNAVTLGVTQSNNATVLGASTNNAFVGIAGKIQAPVTVVPQANVTTTLSGTGVLGNGTYSTNANPVTTTTTDNHSNQGNPITTTNPIAGK